MDARYRADYPGEFVILESKWAGGKKSETREWIPNSIVNQHISGRAACIGSDIDQSKFDYVCLQRHRGGLLSSKKLQTYGTGIISKQMPLDFTVITNNQLISDILEIGYEEKNIVYTTARNCIAHPGKFYLVPMRLNITDMASIVYLAAFDGHKEIFLLGYHKESNGGKQNWIGEITEIFSAYVGTQFYLVGEKTIMPDEWLECANVSVMDYRAWISYCDV
jgi:hypothetical protein